jgi:enoyl-CoA hydratase/carnithine racemase
MSMLEISDEPVKAGSPERIRVIKLARPPVNALNGELIGALIRAVESARNEAAIVIGGQPGVFSGGLDVPGLLALDREGLHAVFIDLWRLQRAVATSPVPVIFALTGHSPAGGAVLAIHGDYRVMAQGEFKLGLNEVQVGLFPGPMIHGAFRRLVGGHAAQLLTRGALIDPAAALRVGLVDELCETAQVASRALEVAREFCALPREPMLRTRALVRRDLVELFGDPAQAAVEEQQFAAVGTDLWSVPSTQERLKAIFLKKKGTDLFSKQK